MRAWPVCTLATPARPEIRRFPLAYTSRASVGSSAINKEQLAPTQHLRPRTQPISCRETLFRTTFELHFEFWRATRRQQVEGEGNSSGKNRHAAPVCRIHRMPSKHARFDAQGRPRLSCRRRGGGSMGSTSSHWSSVNSFCRFFMAEAHQRTRLIRKYLAGGRTYL